MKSPRAAVLAMLVLTSATTLLAAHVDMNEARRAVARDENIRIDAQLMSESVSPGTPVAVTYQIENLGKSAVAIADKVADASYDADSRTITLSIGAEIPTGTAMPHLALIAPGEKLVLHAGATATIVVPRRESPFAAIPRYVQIKVNLLRDLAPFAKLIEQQRAGSAQVPLPDDMFEQWVESNDAVFLNTLPVRWEPRGAAMGAEAEARRASW